MIESAKSLNAGEQGKGRSWGQQISSAISTSSIFTLVMWSLVEAISGKKYNMSGRPGGDSGLEDGLIR